jgi:inosine triphosphate pyrophosphatase
MVSSYDDKTGYAQCIFGLMKSKKNGPHLFVGKTDGEIVAPRGPENFGWDPCFQPKGFNTTFAEMSSEQKNSISHRYKALKEMIDWIKNNPDFF